MEPRHSVSDARLHGYPVGALREDAAARYCGVGVTTFRGFGIPRTLLPGTSGRPIPVYRIADLEAFLERHRERPVHIETRRAS
jgi:hypothetical protein